jgi:hypothetical protein
MSCLGERWLSKGLCCFGRSMGTACSLSVDARPGHDDEFIDDVHQGGSQIVGDIFWAAMCIQHCGEEHSRRRDVGSFRHAHVDHLAMLVNSSADAPPDFGDFDVGLINEPAVPDTAPA